MNKETWEPISGYEGWYSVSNKGRVRRDMPSIKTKKGRILKYSKIGYPRVSLSKGSRASKKTFMIHLLVGKAFLGIRPYKFTINHKNGIKYDNRIENLEYLSYRDNNLHAIKKLGRKICRGSESPFSKINEKKAMEIIILYKSKKYFQREIGDFFGIDRSTVSAIIRRKIWKHL